jgi:hypothetical protein
MEEARKRRVAAGRTGGGEKGQPISEMDPSAVAALVVYLCTDEAANISGRDFYVASNHIGLFYLPFTADKEIFTTDPSWTLDSLAEVFQSTLGRGLVNVWGPKDEQ